MSRVVEAPAVTTGQGGNQGSPPQQRPAPEPNPPSPPPAPHSTPAVILSGTLAGIEAGARLNGVVVGLDDSGQSMLRTDRGRFVIVGRGPFPTDTELQIQVLGVATQIQAMILTRNGKPLNPPASLTLELTEPATTPTVSPAVATGPVELAVGAELTATVLAQPVAASEMPLAPDSRLLLQVLEVARAPAGAPATTAAPAAEVLSAVVVGRQETGPLVVRTPVGMLAIETSSPLAVGDRVVFAVLKVEATRPIPTAVRPNAGAAKPGAAASRSAPAPLQNVAPPTDGAPRPTGSSSPLSTDRQPGPTGTARPPAPQGVGASARPAGPVLPVTGDGQPVRVVAPPLPYPSEPPPTPAANPPMAITEVPPAPASLMAAWPALEETFESLVAVNPAVAQSVFSKAIPQPNARLAGTVLFFLSALRAGDVRAWLGDQATRLLHQQGRGEPLSRLADDVQQLARLTAEPGSGDWRALIFPLFDGLRWHQVQLFARRHRRGGEDGESGEEETRFVVEFALSRLGDMQLDGLVRAAHFDLIVRSAVPLAIEMRQDIAAIFDEALAIGGYQGSVVFQNGTPFPVDPLKEINDGNGPERTAPTAAGEFVV